MTHNQETLLRLELAQAETTVGELTRENEELRGQVRRLRAEVQSLNGVLAQMTGLVPAPAAAVRRAPVIDEFSITSMDTTLSLIKGEI